MFCLWISLALSTLIRVMTNICVECIALVPTNHSALHTYPDDTLIYPGHDYNGETQSTVGKEKRNNPRLQVNSEAEYVEIMHNLKLPNPKLMDIAVPANQQCGKV